jgi:RND family efflux transporter MFP subunit
LRLICSTLSAVNIDGDHVSEAIQSGSQRPGILRTLLICAGIVAVGLLSVLWIFNSEPEVQRESAVRENAMLVDVVAIESGTFRPVIEVMGTVRPSREIELKARISGQVMSLAAEMVPGGEVFPGEVLFRLDDDDYRIALEQRRSELLQAQAQLEIEQGRQEIAERDYRQLNKELDADNRALVLREPQLRSAQAEVRAAQAAVDKALLDLERTSIAAPFHAQVMDRMADTGALISQGDPLARLVGVDTYWVEATLPLDRLPWLSFAESAESGGSPVELRNRGAWPAGQSRQGRLLRLVGELEGDTRMARVLVAVDDPLARAAEHSGEPALIVGSFLQCRIQAREIEDVVRVRREHLRKDDSVWLMRDEALVIVAVDVVFKDAEYAYLRGDINATDRLVVTSLSTVRDGVPLRTATASPRAIDD